MSAETFLARGRAAAERLMSDTCQIRRRTGESTGAGGVVTPVYASPPNPLYTGVCRVQSRTQTQAGTDVGEAYLILERREVQLPMSVTGLREGDQITITASVLDPDLTGRVYAVRDVLTKTHATARRVTVIEVTS
jgi:hypothetical protein